MHSARGPASRRVTAWVVVAVTVGCGQSQQPASPDAALDAALQDAAQPDVPIDAPPLADLCAAEAEARCHDLDSCGAYLDRSRYRDESDCRARSKVECLDQATLPGIVDPAPRIVACTKAMNELSCEDRKVTIVPPGCAPMPYDAVGTLPDGAACRSHAQCASGACANSWAPYGSSGPQWPNCGACGVVPRVGSPCTDNSQCYGSGELPAPHLACDPVAHACVAVKEGMPCGTSPPSGCVCRAGVCDLPSVREGGFCDPTHGCAAGLYCDTTTNACRPFALSYVGGACDDPTTVDFPTHLCRGDSYCDGGGCVPVEIGATCVFGGTTNVCGNRASCVRGADKKFRCTPLEGLCRGP